MFPSLSDIPCSVHQATQNHKLKHIQKCLLYGRRFFTFICRKKGSSQFLHAILAAYHAWEFNVARLSQSFDIHHSSMNVLAIAMQLALLYGLDVYNHEDNDDEEPVRIRPFMRDGSFNVQTFSEE